MLVLDYEALGPDAEAVIYRLRFAAGSTRILVLAAGSNSETVERILRAGASGVFGKQHELALLVRALRAVAAGELWADRRATAQALESLTGSFGGESARLLTRRERQVLVACTQGLRNKEIASRLNIRTRTVKGHLSNIYRKLEVDNRFALYLRHRPEAVHPAP